VKESLSRESFVPWVNEYLTSWMSKVNKKSYESFSHSLSTTLQVTVNHSFIQIYRSDNASRTHQATIKEDRYSFLVIFLQGVDQTDSPPFFGVMFYPLWNTFLAETVTLDYPPDPD
jgi:hypothetical protein